MLYFLGNTNAGGVLGFQLRESKMSTSDSFVFYDPLSKNTNAVVDLAIAICNNNSSFVVNEFEECYMNCFMKNYSSAAPGVGLGGGK